jgi:DNA replication and repair protein RecF
VSAAEAAPAPAVRVRRLWHTDFRSYTGADVAFAPGVTVVVGANGQGKTNLLEAIGYAGSQSSFRGAPAETLVRAGAAQAVVRADIDQAGRDVLIEAEIAPTGRSRAQVNKQRVARARDLLGQLPVTVFTPDDLMVVKGAPSERRRLLDDVLVVLQPKNDALRAEVERVLRQRNALLKQSGGRLTPDVATTLEVWDTKLAAAGEQLAHARRALVHDLAPLVGEAYRQLAGGVDAAVALSYEAPWLDGGLLAALAQRRTDELRRGVTLVGPHRDELALLLNGLPARTHASQGEQRTVALALRLASHRLATARLGRPPVLLLDDVFSELDPSRSEALLAELPVGPAGAAQAVLTTAGPVPTGARPDLVLEAAGGEVRPRS